MSRVLIFILCCVQIFAKIIPPKLTIRALKPTGIWVSIPDERGLTKYEFEGSINEKIDDKHPGSFRELLTKGEEGKWSYQGGEATLHLGDVLYYRYHYVKNKEGVHSRTYTFTVEDLVDLSYLVEDRPVNDCHSTVTVVRNRKVCAGQIIFEDNFDSLRQDLWILEQYIAGEPDFAFVSYQQPQIARTIFVQDGYLRIEPRLQQSLPSYTSLSILTGNLDLTNGCTSTASNCVRRAKGANILPPIVSGRMTTKSFSFTYGTIEIRAKLPQGDWLYPDLLLQSISERYGTLNHESGSLRVAGARGNVELRGGDTEYGNKVLYGGVRLNGGCCNHLINRTVGKEAWGNEFHVYTLRWTPEKITLGVDGVEWSRLEPTTDGLKEMFPKECQLSSTMFAGPKIAPFNDLFGITLGVAAGGILEFDDNLDSNGVPKPWSNADHKNSFNFWQDLTSWLPTWKQPALVVDYVKVRAL